MNPAEHLALGGLILAIVVGIFRQVAVARAQRALRESNRFATEIIDSAGEGIIVYDRGLRYVVFNRFMEELTAIKAEDVIGRQAVELFPHIREQKVDLLLERALAGETIEAPDIRYDVPATGRHGWVSALYRPNRDADGNVIGVIAMVRDITERRLAEQEVEYQAYHDALTGLANRRLFEEHLSLAVALAQRHGRVVAVLFLDIDHFKIVNDSLGHTLGDELLRHIGARLRSAVRDGDTVARVGGDEFTIVLHDLGSREDAARVAQKVLRIVADPLEVGGHRLFVTASIGITLFPDDGVDAETLLKNADNAMYSAKAEGRNTYQMSSRELSRSTHDRMTLETAMHLAIERNEFELYYQPQIDLASNRIVGMEALLRWNHPQRGLIGPGEFIQLAEERGYIVLIGDWVLRRACEHAQALFPRGSSYRVAVNISARQFREPTFVDVIEGVVATTGIDPASLELEITERVAMENVDLTHTVLSRLKRIGVTIAIDDFGTGHSSLSYLKRFPFDTLKIDRDFIEDLPTGHVDAAIVSTIIDLARRLELRVVAEGVETEEQLNFLREAGCPEVQGYLFSYPLSVTHFRRLIDSGEVSAQAVRV